MKSVKMIKCDSTSVESKEDIVNQRPNKFYGQKTKPRLNISAKY